MKPRNLKLNQEWSTPKNEPLDKENLSFSGGVAFGVPGWAAVSLAAQTLLRPKLGRVIRQPEQTSEISKYIRSTPVNTKMKETNKN